MLSTTRGTLFPPLTRTVEHLTKQFDQISSERKERLDELAQFVDGKNRTGDVANLNFICTHNSRRSHLAQLWAQAAAHYYGISNVMCYSGGTEATAFNPRAVKAMQGVGFAIIAFGGSAENPVYESRYSENAPAVRAFSKKYDDPFNPGKDFAAIMTCSHADENCPLVVGASARIALTYDDPKAFDGTAQESAKYTERVHEIGREILYAFSRINE
jgi:arsenate reductase (thioredoxin)